MHTAQGGKFGLLPNLLQTQFGKTQYIPTFFVHPSLIGCSWGVPMSVVGASVQNTLPQILLFLEGTPLTLIHACNYKDVILVFKETNSLYNLF